MDNLFLIVFAISMFALTYFAIRTAISAIAKDKVKRMIHLKRTGIALAAMFVSVVGFGMTTSPTENEMVKKEEPQKIETSAPVVKAEDEKATVEDKNLKEVEPKLKEEDEKKPTEKPTHPVTVTKTPPATTAVEINTSVFEYAKDIKLTDAIDINDHVTVMVDMSEELTPGLATQHVVNQSYDFVQQDDIKLAKTITIIVRQADKKIAQYKINTEKFKPNDDEPMSDAVISASEIDSMIDDVKEYGKTMGTW